ncbi:MAG TPA: tRNA pseudouridine(38-40) synthase TruA [Thermoanaerobaculia bacterium]|nr:tRNA pseudouridine(38-40) synthase TruA [Thermoanaerobaculia bacterium]
MPDRSSSAAPVTRWLLELQYLGTRYSGWQIQSNGLGVQEVIEKALGRLSGGRPIRLHGAGRTDAGVHARGQRAHFDLPFEIDRRGLLLGLNGLLPDDIRVVGAQTVAPDFHARFAAKSKTYLYSIWNDPIEDVFLAPTHAHVAQPLDVASMRQAAEALLGHHDFRSFTVISPEVSSTWRTVDYIQIDDPRPVIRIEIRADGFLRFMVRRIAGSLIEVGRGKIPPGAVAAALEPGFGEARWTAEAKGLVLESVDYE